MKTIFVVACLMISIGALGKGDKVDFPRPFEFTLLDSVQGTKADLYIKAYDWIAKNFNSANNVIQMQDKEAGKFIIKGIIPYSVHGLMGNKVGKEYIHFTMSISVKDGRYKCVIYDFYHEAGIVNGSVSYGSLDKEAPHKALEQGWMNKRWADIKATAQNGAEDLLLSLKKSMGAKDDNW